MFPSMVEVTIFAKIDTNVFKVSKNVNVMTT